MKHCNVIRLHFCTHGDSEQLSSINSSWRKPREWDSKWEQHMDGFVLLLMKQTRRSCRPNLQLSFWHMKGNKIPYLELEQGNGAKENTKKSCTWRNDKNGTPSRSLFGCFIIIKYSERLEWKDHLTLSVFNYFLINSFISTPPFQGTFTPPLKTAI